MDFIVAALELVPAVVEAGEDIAQFVVWALSVHQSTDGPSDADWTELNRRETDLRTTLAGVA